MTSKTFEAPRLGRPQRNLGGGIFSTSVTVRTPSRAKRGERRSGGRYRRLLLRSALLIGFTAALSMHAASSFRPVLEGLHNPRGLAFGANGSLYVAEAGQGSGTAEEGVSFTGAIYEIRHPDSNNPKVQPVVTGLPSLTILEGRGEILGIDGISTQGNVIYGIMAEAEATSGQPMAGKLLRITPGGTVRALADIGASSLDWTASVLGNPAYDPGSQYPDSNPYGVLALHARQYVLDSGANTLNEVLPDGTIQILAFFPNIAYTIPGGPRLTTDATPTCLAQGPDGALYIGILALVPSFFDGPSAKIYRVDPQQLAASGEVPILGTEDEWATGLWPIHSLAFGPDGSLYVSELLTHVDLVHGRPVPSGGDVLKVPFDHPNQGVSLTNGGLSFPAGVAVASDGTVYVSNKSTFVPPGSGEVIRLANH